MADSAVTVLTKAMIEFGFSARQYTIVLQPKTYSTTTKVLNPNGWHQNSPSKSLSDNTLTVRAGWTIGALISDRLLKGKYLNHQQHNLTHVR